MSSFTSPEIAMITLASLIAVSGGGSVALMDEDKRENWLVLAIVFHIVILSLGIQEGGDKTLFISYMCWAWTYLFAFYHAGYITSKVFGDNYIVQQLGVAWWLSILGTAIWSASKNTRNPVDNWSLCVFGLVTTMLIGGPVLYKKIVRPFLKRFFG